MKKRTPEQQRSILKRLKNNTKTPDMSSIDNLMNKEKVNRESLSQDTVQLNSLVEVQDLEVKRNQRIKIVLPDFVDLKNRWISVFAPLSAVLLGRRKGDVVMMDTNGVSRKLKVIDVIN